MSSNRVLELDVAENVLLAAELSTLLTQPPLVLCEEDMKYPHNSIGDDDIRGAIAALWNETCDLSDEYRLTGEHVVCTPGASAALYFHGMTRLLAGQSVIIPSPYWNNFDRVYKRVGVPLIRLPIPHDSPTQVQLQDLIALHDKLKAQGQPPGLLLLTNPHNPLGLIETGSHLEAILDWVLDATEMDVVVDEIYAHTLHGSTPFVSVMSLPKSLSHPERVHAVWGFAKDFGLSGWMAGVLLTRSSRMVRTISSGYARFSPFDKLKSRLLRRLMIEGVAGYSARQLLALFDERLRELHKAVAQQLDQHEIPFNREAQGAPFFWLDLRAWLPVFAGEDDPEGALQTAIAEQAGVALVRGKTLYQDERGFMRLCFTAAQPEAVLSAIQRLVSWLQACRP